MARPADPEKPLSHALLGVGRGVVTSLARPASSRGEGLLASGRDGAAPRHIAKELGRPERHRGRWIRSSEKCSWNT